MAPWLENLTAAAAGLGVFLYGMSELETALERLAGRPFKRFLRRHTRNPIESILSGIAVTALLQSSSVVSLMVLAFVGVGVLEFRNAVGIIVGANLGTTFTGWIVATVGFKVDIEAYAFLVAGGGALAAFFGKSGSRTQHLGRLFVGFGLLFVGLAAMKNATETVAGIIDFAALKNYPDIVFALAAFAFTALIHSSSAAMVLTLSLLAAGLVDLQTAASIVIGADMGTTVTAVIGAAKGSAAKKRVAAAQVLFNLANAIVAFALRYPLLSLLQQGFGMTDPLLTLVAFHSSFNLMGIALLLPVLGPATRWLESMFREREEAYAGYIRKVPVAVPEAAVEAVAAEARDLLRQVASLDLAAFGIVPPWPVRAGAAFDGALSHRDAYRALKHLEGEILNYALGVQKQPLDTREERALAQALRAVREAMYSAKSVKDIVGDLEAFAGSLDDATERWTLQVATTFKAFVIDLFAACELPANEDRFRAIAGMFERAQSEYDDFVRSVYAQAGDGRVDEAELSTRLNVNRELYSAKKSLLLAARDVYLPPQQAADVANVPLSLK